MRRRTVLLGGLAAAATVALKPKDHGGSHDDYFRRLSAALTQAQLARPTLIVDQARFAHNIEQVRAALPAGPQQLPARLVVKSLPSLPLLTQAADALKTRRFMVFNLPMLDSILAAWPDADILMGKPVPVLAVRHWLYEERNRAFLPRIQWLVDHPDRLTAYGDLSNVVQTPLRISLELDVGLHRGGLATPADLKAVLAVAKKYPQLQVSGLMAYEAHVGKLPTALGMQDKAWTHVQSMLKGCTQVLRDSGYAPERMTINSGGSLTYRMHAESTLANDISLGSALVLPSDFDKPTLKSHQAAAFIATPVLKITDHALMPGIEWTDPLRCWWDPNAERGYFIHGGHWLADPVSPPGLESSSLYGQSSNQELWLGSATVSLQPDDYVFFRPRQSEAVFLQFGDIAVYDEQNARIVKAWPVFPASA